MVYIYVIYVYYFIKYVNEKAVNVEGTVGGEVPNIREPPKIKTILQFHTRCRNRF